ncbi:hypothetical protein [Nocardioides hwasunensis]|uniref:Uncharacterized protein n=1 Tax=Nocardioides hwasunensis TaxID=397258 RepID=A0ABR8MJS5_9ACTN|nr:hypothetical protein [Nocardioides hwasunensis]MBD3916287.1 hypothetical protein [Nocardioides hwasunensis]
MSTLSDSDLTPEQDAVRRLLADARHDGPPPAEVVGRLDDTLASLVAERGGAPLETGEPAATGAGSVVDLRSRRRRVASLGVLAAAAVVVAGVALGQALPRGAGGDDGGSSADTSAARQLDDPSSGGSADDRPSDEGGAATQMAPEGNLKSTAPTSAPTLSADDPDLEQKLLDVRSRATSSRASGPSDVLDSCALSEVGTGRRLVTEVDGQVGVVLFRRPDGATQQVDLYVCGSDEPVRTLTLPAP